MNNYLIQQKIILKLIITVFVLYVMFYNLGGHCLEDWDEAFYAVMAETAIKNNNYLFLEYQNEIHWSKTPFPVYPMMLSFKLLGVNEISARIPSAFFALGILLQIYYIAKHYYGDIEALLAVLIAITSEQFIFYHGLKTANIESITLFFLTGSISSWLLIKNHTAKIITTIMFLSATFMCKGPIVLIPAIILSLSCFKENPFKNNYLKGLTIGFVIAVLTILPWYIYAIKLHGDIFIKNHIIYNFLQRYTEGIEGNYGEKMYFLKYILSSKHFIWNGAAILSVIYFIKLYIDQKRLSDLVILSWIIITFVIVNQSQTKLWWYMYPIYPPLAIAIAVTLVNFIKNPSLLNRLSYYICALSIVSYLYNFDLFYEILSNNFNGIVRATLIIITIIVIFEIAVSRFIENYSKYFRVLLILAIIIYPIFNTVRTTNKEYYNAPILSYIHRTDFSKTVYLFTIHPRIVFPSDYYYLSLITEVIPIDLKRADLPQKTRGLIRTELLENFERKGDNIYQYIREDGRKIILEQSENKNGISVVEVY